MTTPPGTAPHNGSPLFWYAFAVCAVFIVYSALFFFILNAVHAHGHTTQSLISGTEHDSAGYLALGRALLETAHFSLPDEPMFSYFRTPGYPFFIALILGIFRSDIAVPFAQFILVGISAIFVFLLGRRFHSTPLGLSAAALYLLDPLTIAESFMTMSETLFVCLFLGAMTALTSTVASRSKLFGGGVLIGLSILVRPIGSYIVPVFLLWLLLKDWKEWRIVFFNAACFLVGVILVVSPWMARNYLEAGHVGISTSGPFNMLIYNVPEFEHQWRGVPPQETRAQIYAQLGLPDSQESYQKLQGFSYVDAENKLTISYVSQAPLLYGIYHLASTGPFFFGSDIFATENLLFAQAVIPTRSDNVNHSYLLFHGHIREFLLTITADMPQFIERIGWLLLFIGSFITVVHALATRSYRALLALLFFALILAFAILTGPQSQPRYRMPVAPLLFILGISGLGVAVSYFKTWFQPRHSPVV